MTPRSRRCRRTEFFLQVLSRQIGQDRLVYLVFAERRLILPKAQAPQPDHNVHDGRLQSGVAHIICWGSEECPGWRWGSQGFAKPAEV